MRNSSDRDPLAQPNQVDLVRNTDGTPANSSLRRTIENPQAGRLYLNGVPATFPIPVEFSPLEVAVDVSIGAVEGLLQTAFTLSVLSFLLADYAVRKTGIVDIVGQQLQRKKTFNNLVTSGQI